jgi:hypothetical protein
MNLHRLAVASVAALAFAFTAAAPAHAQFGIAAGANFNDLDDIDTSAESAVFDESTGYHLGIFVNIGDGPVSLRPGVFYHRIGTYDFPDGDEVDLSSVEVPIDISLNLMPDSPVNLYLLGAPVISFPRGGDDDFSDAFQDVSLGADVGVGLGFELPGGGATLMPELRYSMGLTDYWNDDFAVGGVTVRPSSDARRLSRWMVRLNVMF